MGKTKIHAVGGEPDKKKVHISGLKGGQRVKIVEGAPEKVVEEQVTRKQPLMTKSTKARTRGKKYKAARAKVDPKKTYSLDDATKLVKETSISSFPGSVELHIVLVKDKVNAQVELPHSTGKSKRVEIASDDTVKKLQAGKVDFYVLLASAAMMPKLVPFAKLLGPKGLMPNPKNGTLIDNPEKAAEKFRGNLLNIKTEKSAPLIHTVVGKVNQPENEIEDNIKAVVNSIGIKQIKRASISSSMGPGIKIALA